MNARRCSTEAAESTVDRVLMKRCVELSAKAAERGEPPFAALVAQGARVVVEATNRVTQNADVTQHAELIAVSEVQKVLGTKDLNGCTIYSTVEPCAMCAFPIRETRISKVVYGISSPMMGGLSKWNVLRDSEIGNVMPEVFGPVPEVIAGLLRHEVEQVWTKWNPVAWAVIKYRGCFGPAETEGCDHMPGIPQARSLTRTLAMLHENLHARWGGRNGHN